MTEKIEKSALDTIEVTISLYWQPELLKEGIRIKSNNVNKEKLKEYFTYLADIKFFYNRVLKYEIYFSEFYSESKKIKKTESLEYHIHAYLQDLIILRNKMQHFLGVLKNDLKKMVLNKKEIEESMCFNINQISIVFNSVSQYRNPHQHKGFHFLDSNLVDSDLANLATQENSPFKRLLKPSFLAELEKREVESFEKARVSWVELAKNNSNQISGFVNEIFKRHEKFIYKILNIEPLDDLFKT